MKMLRFSYIFSYFPSKVTCRKGRDWVSEIDICFVSINLVDSVTRYHVIQDMPLPSEHAALLVHLSASQDQVSSLQSSDLRAILYCTTLPMLE